MAGKSYGFMKLFGRRGYSDYQKQHPALNPKTTVEEITVPHDRTYLYYTASLDAFQDEAFGESFVAKQIRVPIEQWEFRSGGMRILLAFVEAENKVLWVHRKPKRLDV